MTGVFSKAAVHTAKSGVAHLAAAGEEAAIASLRELFSFMPQNNLESPPRLETDDPPDREIPYLNEVLPENANQPYDMKEIILNVIDDGHFLEIQPDFAPNLVVGFARLGGMSVGIVANQPQYLAGVLDNHASIKGARFVRFCDAFNIPLVTFVDVPGFLPGTVQEYGGIIRNGAKLLYAYAEATVPKVTVTIRKAYGGAYCVMSSKHLKGDINYAWPSAEIAVMGPKGASEILYAKELKKHPEKAEQLLAEKEREYAETFANPYVAARRGYIDDIILPYRTRLRIIKALGMLENKQDALPAKKHGNIPL